MNDHPVVALLRGKVTDPTSPFVLVGELEAHAGRGDDVVAAIVNSQAISLSRQEPGCAFYDICRDADAPDRFVVYESWCSLAALQDHLATPHFTAVGVALTGLLAAAPSIRVLTSVAELDTFAQ